MPRDQAFFNDAQAWVSEEIAEPISSPPLLDIGK